MGQIRGGKNAVMMCSGEEEQPGNVRICYLKHRNNAGWGFFMEILQVEGRGDVFVISVIFVSLYFLP